MQRPWMTFAITCLILMARDLPLSAHDGHDHGKTESARGRGERVAAAQPPAHANVVIKLFQYQPARLQVAAETTVTLVNEDDIFHSVTAEKTTGFDATLDSKGKSFSFTFSQPGTYAYHCERHEHMSGEIEVR
jgi:plastocyanin